VGWALGGVVSLYTGYSLLIGGSKSTAELAIDGSHSPASRRLEPREGIVPVSLPLLFFCCAFLATIFLYLFPPSWMQQVDLAQTVLPQADNKPLDTIQPKGPTYTGTATHAGKVLVDLDPTEVGGRSSSSVVTSGFRLHSLDSTKNEENVAQYFRMGFGNSLLSTDGVEQGPRSRRQAKQVDPVGNQPMLGGMGTQPLLSGMMNPGNINKQQGGTTGTSFGMNTFDKVQNEGVMGRFASLFNGVTQKKADDSEKAFKEFPGLQTASAEFVNLLEVLVINSLLSGIEESDAEWHEALNRVGLVLSFDEPSTRTADRMNRGVVSVFDRYLPAGLGGQREQEKWMERQRLEAFLVHPSFPLGVRGYVLERLKAWRRLGLKNAYKADFCDARTRINDSHILENLVIKMLDSHPQLQFTKTYLVQNATLYLSADSSSSALDGVVQYTVHTNKKSWRLNIVDAFTVFFLLLENTRGFMDLPLVLRQLVEKHKMSSLNAAKLMF